MRETSAGDVPIESVQRWRAVLHVVLSILMWATYVLYWRVVLHRGVENEARIAGILLLIFLVLQTLLTQSWVRYNREVSRRHSQRRRERPGQGKPPSEDFVGRLVRTLPEESDLTRVPVVIVRIEEGEKRFEAGMPLKPEAPAP